MGYKLKRITIRQNNTELQIYPKIQQQRGVSNTQTGTETKKKQEVEKGKK